MEEIKIKLSVFWAAHFLIWSFGDVVSLLSPGYIDEELPVSNDTLFIAAIIGTVHAYMIIGSITLKDKQNRLFNLVFGGIFTLINVGHLVEMIRDDHPAWAIFLAIVYLSINALILSHAYKWQTDEQV
ncbi:MAG: hypothetical protein ACXAD7_08450 [Candidatus Kariarchaeaceae archaeon]|jgi:hypothetical protein